MKQSGCFIWRLCDQNRCYSGTDRCCLDQPPATPYRKGLVPRLLGQGKVIGTVLELPGDSSVETTRIHTPLQSKDFAPIRNRSGWVSHAEHRQATAGTLHTGVNPAFPAVIRPCELPNA